MKMKICLLEQFSSEDLKPLFDSCNFVPFREYDVEEDLIVNHVIHELSDLISRSETVAVAKEQGKIIGLISLERSDWDSHHFGVDSSKITHLFAAGDYFESLNVKQKLISYLLPRPLVGERGKLRGGIAIYHFGPEAAASEGLV